MAEQDHHFMEDIEDTSFDQVNPRWKPTPTAEEQQVMR